MWQERLDKATVDDSHNGWVWSRDVDGGQDGYFCDIDELADMCEECEIELPEFVFATREKKLRVDVTDIYERLDENGYEGMTENAAGTKEFEAAIDAFNEINSGGFVVYEMDCSRKVRVVSNNASH